MFSDEARNQRPVSVERMTTAIARAAVVKAETAAVLNVPAALSHRTDFTFGCGRKGKPRCHCSLSRELLAEMGAEIR